MENERELLQVVNKNQLNIHSRFVEDLCPVSSGQGLLSTQRVQ